jgi:hypothetical protein
LVVFLLLAQGMTRRVNLYQFPFLIGLITFGFILPQVPALADDSFLPDGAFARFVGFTTLCLVMCWLGCLPRVEPFKIFRHAFLEHRLLVAAACFSLLGAYFYYALSRLPGDMVVGVQMSGASVVYFFFSRLLCYGMTISVLCFARRPSLPALLIICFDLVFYFDRIIVTGKRAETLELFMIFALAFWFYRGWQIPRSIAIALVVLGPIVMSSMSDYRDITRANDAPIWEEIANIDVIGNLENLYSQGGPEVRNGILRVNDANSRMNFDYGKVHWNHLIYDFVPSQFTGSAFKEALMLPMPKLALDYMPLTGTTETGMADAFQSFWYFGAIKFLILAYLVNRLWVSANAGYFVAQVAYSLTIVPGIHSISHQTDWVLSAWVHMIIFLPPALLYARVSAKQAEKRIDDRGDLPPASAEKRPYAFAN